MLSNCGSGDSNTANNNSPHVVPSNPTRYEIVINEDDFKNIPVGNLSLDHTSTIKFNNNSAEDFTISDINLLDVDNKGFTIVSPENGKGYCQASQTVASKSSCNILVKYHPIINQGVLPQGIFGLEITEDKTTVVKYAPYSSINQTTIDGVTLSVDGDLDDTQIGESKTVNIMLHNDSKYLINSPTLFDPKIDGINLVKGDGCSNNLEQGQSCVYGTLSYTPTRLVNKSTLQLTGSVSVLSDAHLLMKDPLNISYSSSGKITASAEFDFNQGTDFYKNFTVEYSNCSSASRTKVQQVIIKNTGKTTLYNIKFNTEDGGRSYGKGVLSRLDIHPIVELYHPFILLKNIVNVQSIEDEKCTGTNLEPNGSCTFSLWMEPCYVYDHEFPIEISGKFDLKFEGGYLDEHGSAQTVKTSTNLDFSWSGKIIN